MALTANGILKELDSQLDALSLSTNDAIDQVRAGEVASASASSLNGRINEAVKRTKKLIAKGKAAEASELLGKYRGASARAVVFGRIPNMDAELSAMEAMIAEVEAGGTLDPSLANGTEAERLRFFTVRSALASKERFGLVLDEIADRAKL